MLPLVLAVLFSLAYAGSQMARPYAVGQALPMTLDPWMLPYYLLRTTLRMFMALVARQTLTPAPAPEEIRGPLPMLPVE